MTTIEFTPSAHRASVGPSLAMTVTATVAVTVALLSGCGGGTSTADGPVVTVTTTPTVTASVAPPPSTAIATTTQAGVKSDGVGRKFDLGTIVRLEEDGGVPVIIFDRWTVRGMSDSKLAANGVPIAVHSDAPYQNLNTKNTFRIPVLKGAVFTHNHCVSVDQPAQQRSSTLQEFARLQSSEKVMLLTLDPKGQVSSAQNDPAC